MWKAIAVVIMILAASGVVMAEKADKTAARLSGEWPKSTLTIDVDLNGTVADALQLIAKKAGWSLVVSAPTIDTKLALRSAKRPVYEVLGLVLEAGDLVARLDGQTLIVKAQTKSEEDAEAEAEAEQQRQEDADETPDAMVPPIPPVPPLPPNGKVVIRDKEDVTAVGQDLIIKKDEVVNDAVVTGGDLVVYGRVKGDAVAMGGSVLLNEGAVVEGDATAFGGKVRIEKGAILKGDKNDMGPALGGVFKKLAKSMTRAREHHEHREHRMNDDDDESGFGWALFAMKVFAAIAAFILGVILMAFAPERVGRVRDVLRDKPIQSTAAGFAALIGFLPFCILLTVTVVGLALVPLAGVALLCVYIVGYVALGLWLGDRVWPPKLGDKHSPLAAMSTGLALLSLLTLIPWLGSPLVFFASTFAAGAVMISRVGAPPLPSGQ